MAKQIHRESSPARQDEEVVQEFPVNNDTDTAVESTAVKDEELDGLLDEIEKLLEPNAQQFVDEFQQIGGQ